MGPPDLSFPEGIAAKDFQAGESPRDSGSIWVDPGTCRVMRAGAGGIVDGSKTVYAVGAMTRGQFIDASTAMGSVRSTARIAREWTDALGNRPG